MTKSRDNPSGDTKQHRGIQEVTFIYVRLPNGNCAICGALKSHSARNQSSSGVPRGRPLFRSEERRVGKESRSGGANAAGTKTAATTRSEDRTGRSRLRM